MNRATIRRAATSRPTHSRRGLKLEPLERRHLLASLWRNPVDSLDVDADGYIAPRDALLVINELVAQNTTSMTDAWDPAARYPDTDGDGVLAPCDALILLNFFNAHERSQRHLREDLDGADYAEVTIGLGQPSGARLYRVQIDATFERPTGSQVDDLLTVALVDRANPTNVLLDGGLPETPLFTLAGGVAEYGGSIAGWDGSVLTIDLTNLQSRDTGLLKFQWLDRNADLRSRATIRPLDNEIDEHGTASSVFPNDENPAIPNVEENAATSATSNFSALARWGDTDAGPATPVSERMHINAANFDFNWGGVILGLVTQSAADSPLDPGFARVTPLVGAPARTLVHKSQSIGGRDSLSLVRLGSGDFQVDWSSDRSTIGAGHLAVFLAGDANGDFQVNQADFDLIHSRRGASSGSAGYLIDADVNRDGVISRVDEQFARLNSGTATTVRPLVVTANLAPNSDLDGNGVVLVPDVTVRGQSMSGVAITTTTVHGTSEETQDSSARTADSQGRFEFATHLAAGANVVRIAAEDAFGQRLSIERTVSLGDVILDWNASVLNVIRDWTTLSNDPYSNRVVTERPPVAARNLAMIHTAMYQAVNAVEGTDPQFHVDVEAPPSGTSPVAAAAAAAERVAAQLYGDPDERAVFEAALAEALASVPDGTSKTQGIELGRTVGDQILAWRAVDGATAVIPFSPGTAPGDWQRTFPDFLPPLLPQWPYVTPFVMTTGSMVRAAAPPPLNSAEYAANVDEVLRLGGFDSPERTADQTATALFWADGGGTYTPPGHWNQIAADVSLARGVSLADNARLFATLNMALADAGISSWDAKYYFQLWRPIDAIRRGDTDGNPATTADSNWIPLLKTPPFPTYTSGHSTFSGAASTVLAAFFGDHVEFRSQADGHQGFTQRPLSTLQVTTRSFASFTQAAEEAGRSRIYGGIHFEFDNSAGLEAGRSIGALVVQEFLARDP